LTDALDGRRHKGALKKNDFLVCDDY